MYFRISFLFFLFFWLHAGVVFSQTKGKIIEKETKLPVAFASVVFQDHDKLNGVISDVNGYFEIRSTNIKQIKVACLGYKSEQVLLEKSSENVIVELEVDSKELGEVVVTPASNPAFRIIRNVLKAKDLHNYEKYDSFQYNSYVKTIMDLRLARNANANDSALVLRNEKLKRNALFITEYVIKASKVNSNIQKSIIAQKTSGFKNPLFAQTFAIYFHHAISFYNNRISLLSLSNNSDLSITEYESPLSDGCMAVYNYNIADTIIYNGSDTIFVIDYYPKKGIKLNSFKGKLFISTHDYALKSVIAENFEEGLINFKFKQDYDIVGEKWFPVRLEEEISASEKIRKDINAYFVYLLTSKIDSIHYNDIVSPKTYSLDAISIDNKMEENSEAILNNYRQNSFNEWEKNTYLFYDSISAMRKLDYVVELMPKLFVGRIPVKFVDIDLYRLYSYNQFEKSRWGMGLHTNEQISEYASLGGYWGYGMHDKTTKYGGQIDIFLTKNKNVNFSLFYQKDLKEVGSDVINDFAALSSYTLVRSYMGYRYDQCDELKARFSFRPFKYLKFTGTYEKINLRPIYSYIFKGSFLNEYSGDNFQLKLDYVYHEEFVVLGKERINNDKGNPVVSITYHRGLNTSGHGYSYNKYETSLDLRLYHNRIGQSNFKISAGYIDKVIPYGLLFTGEGSRDNDFPFWTNNTFQTVSPYEFLSNKYINVFYAHNFGTLIIKTKFLKPQFTIIQNSGYGNLNHPEFHDIDFKLKNKVFLESGLIINSIIRLNYKFSYFGIGCGAFYRYGYYSFDHIKNNMVFKLAFSLTLK